MSQKSIVRSSRCSTLAALLFTTVAPLAFAADVKPVVKPVLRPADTQLRVIGAAILSVRKETPSLPAFKEYEALAQRAFSGRSKADGELLMVRLYHDSVKQMEAQGAMGAIAKPAVLRKSARTVLSGSQNLELYTRDYFDALLKEERQKQNVVTPGTGTPMELPEEELTFDEKLISIFGWDPAWNSWPCLVDGVRRDSSWCRSLIFTGAAGRIYVGH